MFNKEDYELVSYHNNYEISKKNNSLNKDLLIKVKDIVKKIVDFSEVILVHECNNFENFSGRDIDTFYLKNKFLDIQIDENFVFHERDYGTYRFFINHQASSDFFCLDLENLSIFSPKTPKLNLLNMNEAQLCEKTGLKHLKLNAILYYKLVKYFSQGVVFSYEQLFKIKKTLNSLKKEDLNYVLNLVSKNLPKENIYIKKLIETNFENFENDSNIKKFWKKKRFIRQNKRKVFAGDMKLKNLFRSKKFVYALIFGSYAKWRNSHNPLPAVTIVGNDGAGKTSICDYVIKNFSKMEPAYLNMKSDVPLMSFTKYSNKVIRKLLNYSIIKKITPIKIIFKFLGQSFDILDQYVKYRIGMAFADSGFGITIFERYITDKLRGEYPNKKNKFLPLEQFFPFPDGIFYIDIKPEISLERKSNDNHTLEEMTSKRQNYISLLEEFSEVKKDPNWKFF